MIATMLYRSYSPTVIVKRPPPHATLAAVLVATLLVSGPARAQDAGAPGPDAAVPAPDAAPGAPAVVAPVCLQHARPEYPRDADGRRVDVELLLTVDERGNVSHVEVLGHIPPDAPESFDRAAREAARTIRFRPAMRDGQPVTVRVRYHMAISPPLVALDAGARDAAVQPPEIDEHGEVGGGTEGLVHTHAPPDAGAPPPHTPPTVPPPGAEEEQGATVRAAAPRGRTPTEYVIPVGPLANVPRQTGTDLLTLAPGVLLSNEGGTEGHAAHVFLRGFTGENGQDIAFSLDGIPLNEESNTHSQGYADLYFVIPELVQRLDVTEGTADPRQGNFAVAGSINYRLGLHQRGLILRASYGMYGYRRFLALYGPPRASDATFAGVDLVHSDGFGSAGTRNFDRASGLAQHELDLGSGTTLRLLAGLYASRWVSPGVIREDDFEAGRVRFFDVYPNTGRQGGFSTRALAAAALEWRRERERAELRLFAQARDLSLTENFTGYVVRRTAGDLIEQTYGGTTVGANGFYQRDVRLFGRVHDAEVGWFLRHDRYALGQRRLDALTNAPAETTDPSDVDAAVHATNVGVYVDATARLHDRFTLRGGARFDAMAYDVTQSVFAMVDRAFHRVHRTAIGVHLGPKATAEVNLGRGFTALASLGSGFRSPEALSLADGENAPFASVTSQEVGVRYVLPATLSPTARLTASLAGYHALVGQDLLFDPVAGRAVPIGATRRLGAVLYLRTQPVPWLDVNASLTYTRATVESDALGRTVPAGSLLPYVPQWVGRLDAAADRQVATFRELPLRVHGGLGVQYYGPRPLPLDDRSEPVFLVDASAGARLGPVDLGLSARNLLDARWRDAQLNFASNYVPGATPSLFPVRHFTAGAPFTLFATLTFYL
jgi:TonB family protein